jgi:CheY-like chemotaxis protein
MISLRNFLTPAGMRPINGRKHGSGQGADRKPKRRRFVADASRGLASGLDPSSTWSMAKTRVLLVEDDADIRETARDALEEFGFVVDVQPHGMAAIEWLLASPANRPDVIVLDLLMPVMNGRAFLDAIRNEPKLAKLPIVVSTAVRMPEVDPLPAGVVLVRKPYEIEELLRAIDTAMAAPPSERGDPSGIFGISAE